jgi:hypothetical protein
MSLFTLVDHGVTVNRYWQIWPSAVTSKANIFFRFSQDLQLIDMELPASAIGVAVGKCNSFGTLSNTMSNYI